MAQTKNSSSGFTTDVDLTSLVVIAGLTAVLFAGALAIGNLVDAVSVVRGGVAGVAVAGVGFALLHLAAQATYLPASEG